MQDALLSSLSPRARSATQERFGSRLQKLEGREGGGWQELEEFLNNVALGSSSSSSRPGAGRTAGGRASASTSAATRVPGDARTWSSGSGVGASGGAYQPTPRRSQPTSSSASSPYVGSWRGGQERAEAGVGSGGRYEHAAAAEAWMVDGGAVRRSGGTGRQGLRKEEEEDDDDMVVIECSDDDEGAVLEFLHRARGPRGR